MIDPAGPRGGTLDDAAITDGAAPLLGSVGTEVVASALGDGARRHPREHP